MVPTFENGNYLIVDKISYKFKEPTRADVIVFRYPNDKTKFFIKRIIGLPGETIDINGSIVTIVNKMNPDGFILDQSYIKNQAENKIHLTLKGDEYFVMGDNRSGSSDSRYWGPLKKDLITGKAFLRLLPINNIDIWPGDYKGI
jgi:signal peptidase I